MGRPAGSTTKTSATKTTSTSNVNSIAKQQFDILNAAQRVSKQLEELPLVVEQLKTQVKEIEDNFAYQLQEKEIEHDDRRKEKDAQLAEYTVTIDERKAQLEAELEAKRVAQQREIEQLEYEHKVAIREKRYDVATRIANEQNKQLVDTAQFKELQMIKRANDEDLANVAHTTELQVTQRLTDAHTVVLKELKAANTLEVAMLRKDIESALKQVEQVKADKAILEKHIADQTATIARIADNATRPTTTIVEGSKK
jgi:hypothetical protein